MALDLAELIEMRDALIRARAKGVLIVQMGDERIQYRTDAEMVSVLADLEARIKRASNRTGSNTVRFSTSKGM